jgi:hypothetical protein
VLQDRSHQPFSLWPEKWWWPPSGGGCIQLLMLGTAVACLLHPLLASQLLACSKRRNTGDT